MELNEYLVSWFHQYVVHFGAWVTFVIGATVYKNGAPSTVKACVKLILMAALLGAVGALFSSHSNMHYLSYLTKAIE